MRRALLLLPLFSWVGACSLDWGSLEPEGGEPLDAAGDVVKITDAHPDTKPQDSSPGTDAADDVTTDDSGNQDAAADGPLDSGSDVFDSGVVEAGSDASDAGVDASDAGCAYTTSGTLATWDLSKLTGITTSAPATSTASGITAADISRSSAITAVSASGAINSDHWGLSTTVDTTKYYTLKVTPPSGCTMALTAVYVDTAASGSGPTSGDVATSADTFTTMSSFTPGTASSVTLSVSGETTGIEIRVYGYNATLTGGTMRIQTSMTVSGSLK